MRRKLRSWVMWTSSRLRCASVTPPTVAQYRLLYRSSSSTLAESTIATSRMRCTFDSHRWRPLGACICSSRSTRQRACSTTASASSSFFASPSRT
eukprot:5507885-Prymnesium_polylepis.1